MCTLYLSHLIFNLSHQLILIVLLMQRAKDKDISFPNSPFSFALFFFFYFLYFLIFNLYMDLQIASYNDMNTKSSFIFKFCLYQHFSTVLSIVKVTNYIETSYRQCFLPWFISLYTFLFIWHKKFLKLMCRCNASNVVM